MTTGPQPPADSADAWLQEFMAELVAGRQALGLSPTDMATYLGLLSGNAILAIERSVTVAPAFLVAAYVRALGEELLWFVDGEAQAHGVGTPEAASDDLLNELMLKRMGGDPGSVQGKRYSEHLSDAVVLRRIVSDLGVAFDNPLSRRLLARTSGVPIDELELVLTHRKSPTVGVLLQAYAAAEVDLRLSTPSAELRRSSVATEEPSRVTATAADPVRSARTQASQHPGGMPYWRAKTPQRRAPGSRDVP